MPTWNIAALLFAVALSLGMAIVGGLLRGLRFGLVGARVCDLGAWLRHSLGLSTLATEPSPLAAFQVQVFRKEG